MTRAFVILILLTLTVGSASADEFALAPITNEVSYYKNSDDDFKELGETLQIISINSFKAFTWFNFEFTGDFNWDATEGQDYDYYLEVSLVKSITSNLSLNYQRIYGTFISEPINQFGLRLSL
jgi:hypothetical protein